jgi:chemotaxis family two-component system response regulator Rcp1
MVKHAIDVLLVEDDPGDVELTKASLAQAKIRVSLSVVGDGEEAIAYLNRSGAYKHAPTPDLVLLDLNLPRKSGGEVLTEMRNDPVLKRIPVVILTTSDADEDIVRSYTNGANCYVTKPVGLQEFDKVVHSIADFWFAVVKLPTQCDAAFLGGDS